MPPLEGDEEEAKTRKGLKILTPNKPNFQYHRHK